jgi:hypothetical protein
MPVFYLEVVFYILDLLILLTVRDMLKKTRKIELKIQQGFRWLYPALFILFGVLCLLRFQGSFRIIEALVMFCIDILYAFIGTGLCPEGIIAMGREVKWQDANAHLDRQKPCLYYQLNKRRAALFLQPEEVEPVEQYLRKHAGKNWQ